ncbi:hypothetical protein ABZX40_03230 [Streptomyces sp. NPDC004610]|uniref:hypothetical protein n=1 Tax=unclassified Streptomyces TaxID=2593676 RepID=UPI0033B22DD9
MGKGGESIPDEEWERFARDAGGDGQGVPEEPSARARMVTRRLQEEGGRPEPWRGHQPPRRRGGKGRYVVGLLALAAVLVVALDPGRVTGWFGGENQGADGPSAPLAAESERPDAPPPTDPAVQGPTVEEPFRGSPAVEWADGAAGIALPEARATGWMDKAEVARTLELTRDFLVESSLDSGVLKGDRPKQAIELMNPHQQDVQDYLTAAFRTPSKENDPLLLFSRFEESEFRLVGDVIKTRGRLTYEEGDRESVEVTADVTYVYPVARADGSDEVTRTIVRRETVLSWDDPVKIVTEPGTFTLLSYMVDTTNGGCGTFTGYLTPRFDSELAGSSEGDGPVTDPYDRSDSMDSRMSEPGDAACGTATRN